MVEHVEYPWDDWEQLVLEARESGDGMCAELIWEGELLADAPPRIGRIVRLTPGPDDYVETSDRPATGHSSDGIQLSIDPELDVEE